MNRGTIYAGSDIKGKISTFNIANRAQSSLGVTGIPYVYDLAVDVDTNRACITCTPTAPTPTALTVCPPTTPTSPTASTSKGIKKGEKAPSPTSKGGKKIYASNGSMMTGLINTTEFNATLGYFNWIT